MTDSQIRGDATALRADIRHHEAAARAFARKARRAISPAAAARNEAAASGARITAAVARAELDALTPPRPPRAAKTATRKPRARKAAPAAPKPPKPRVRRVPPLLDDAERAAVLDEVTRAVADKPAHARYWDDLLDHYAAGGTPATAPDPVNRRRVTWRIECALAADAAMALSDGWPKTSRTSLYVAERRNITRKTADQRVQRDKEHTR